MGSGCSGGTTPTVSNLDVERRAFLAANGINDYKNPKSLDLSLVEANAIADAVKAVSSGNRALEKAVFKHYTKNVLGKFTYLGTVPGNPKAPGEDFNHSKEDMFTHINVDFTHINPRLNMNDPKIAYMTPIMDPLGGLGTLVIHEMVHYQDIGKGLLDKEGAPFGVEYYIARRAKIGRAGEIMQSDKPWLDNGASQYRFCEWCLAMKWCYLNLDGKRTDISKNAAMECIADFVSSGEPFIRLGTDRGQALDFADSEINRLFGTWSHPDRLPGTTEPDGSKPYIAESFRIIKPIMERETP
jgi:hypothetical protein